MTVRAVNGVAHGGAGSTSLEDEEFYELVSLLTEIQKSGGLSFRVEQRDKDDVAIVRIETEAKKTNDKARHRISEILGLDPLAAEYRLVFGRQASAPDEIAMLTRSILEMLASLAHWIDVPPEHVASGRVQPRPSTEAMEEYGFEPMIAVHSSTQRPDDVFVTVRYGGLWFWIDHEDFASKRTLGFMQLMFSLAESSGGQKEPVVTVQAGG